MKPGKTGLARLIDATGYSIKGLAACWRHEAAFRADVLLFVGLMTTSFFVARSIEQWLLLTGPLYLLLMVELLNSAVEAAIDRIGSERHHLSGRAKDMASAAIMLCLVLIVASWGAIIWKNYF
jgi:diacylglycerol kinase (ATP)